MSKKSFYVAVILLLFVASFYIAKKIKQHTAPQINLLGIVLKDLNGNAVDLASFAGKPLVVNFWGTWCGPCRQELPGFEKARGKYNGRINFLLISDEPAAQIQKFKDDNSYAFLYYQSLTHFKDAGITSVPVTYFYNAKGKLTHKTKEPLSEVTLNGFIDDMIKYP